MNYLLFLFGLSVVLFGFSLAYTFDVLQFIQVFAQNSDEFDDAKVSSSSDTSLEKKSSGNNPTEPGKKYQSDDSEAENNKTYPVGKTLPKYPKIHPSVSNILENANPNEMAKIYGAKMDNDNLFVYVHLNEKPGKSLGVDILSQYKNTVFTKLNLSQMQSLANSKIVDKVTLPEYAVFYGHDSSEGIEFSGADQFHQAGINGAGIKVAIIDDSFFPANSEISGNIANTWAIGGCAGDITCGFTDGNSHGTAVAEIIVDMANGTSLWVYSIDNSLDFFNAVDHAIANDVDIITASLGFPFMGGDVEYRDGTSEAAIKVNQAYSNGTLFTLAAGNDGDSHWKGLYNPINVTSLEPGEFQLDMNSTLSGPDCCVYESVMKFNSSATGNMQACLAVDAGFDFFDIIWNGFPTTSDDYDAFLYDRTMTNLVGYTSGAQNGTSFSTPLEFLFGYGHGEACLVIASDNSTEDHLFHIFSNQNNSFDLPLNDTNRLGSLSTPADATNALTVGAVSFNNSPTNYNDDFLELFSSRGPTDDARTKPEICGPDGTLTHQTTLAGGTKFFGTSAATPHVAATAALLLDLNPSLDVNQLKQQLVNNTRNNTNFSQDNLCGANSGSLSLDNFICNIPISGDWLIENDCILTTTGIAPGNVIIQNNANLIIPSGVSLNIDFANFQLIIKSGGSILIKSGGDIS